jgi:hypothetical protein
MSHTVKKINVRDLISGALKVEKDLNELNFSWLRRYSVEKLANLELKISALLKKTRKF